MSHLAIFNQVSDDQLLGFGRFKNSSSSHSFAKLIEALQIIVQLLCCPLWCPLLFLVYILLEGEVISVEEV